MVNGNLFSLGRVIFLLSLLVFAAPACEHPDFCLESQEGLQVSSASREQALVNGQTDPGDVLGAVVCVGSKANRDGTSSPCGTGTLITSNLVLTARHNGWAKP